MAPELIAKYAAQYGPRGLSALLAAGLAAQLLATGWHVHSAAQNSRTTLLQAPVALAPHTRADLSVGAIMAAHLFGRADAPAEVRTSAAALALSGTIATNDPKRGFAIIGESVQHVHLIAPGALIASGLRLFEVFRDYVTLERDGVLEKVLLPSKLAAMATARVAIEVAAAAVVDEQPAAAAETEDGSAKLLARLNAGPEYDGSGKFTGYRLNPPPKIRRELGVRPGDELVAVNGAAISGQADLDAVLGSGGSAPSSITVERGGARLQIALAR